MPSFTSFALRRGPALSDSGLELMPTSIASRQILSSGNIGGAVPADAVAWQRAKMSTVAQRLREAMDEKAISSGLALSKLTKRGGAKGVSDSAISRYLNNRRTPTWERAGVLAAALDITPEWLLSATLPKAKKAARKPEPSRSEDLEAVLYEFTWPEREDAIKIVERVEARARIEADRLAAAGEARSKAVWKVWVTQTLREETQESATVSRSHPRRDR